MFNYPAFWPRCVFCGDFALDGHLTCGRATCNEREARDRRADHIRQQRESSTNGRDHDAGDQQQDN